MATVHTPVEGFTGTVVGVEFTDGVGETSDDSALAYFRRHNYTIDDAKPAARKTAAKKPAAKTE